MTTPDVTLNSEATSAQRQAATSLPVATLLAFTGGMLDAFLYLVHGHVFAGAMTGNVVLCGLALASGNGANILHHSVPLVAFVFGVLASEWLQSLAPQRSLVVCLCAEILGLTAASLLPLRFPDLPYIFAVVFLAAFQIGTFSTADRFSYSSTYVTGDLRTFSVGLFKALRRESRQEGRRQAGDLAWVVGSFLLGTVVAASLSARLGNHTLWLPVGVLVLILGLIARPVANRD